MGLFRRLSGSGTRGAARGAPRAARRRTPMESLESRLFLAADFSLAFSVGGRRIDDCYAMAVDPAGNMYIAGEFFGTADFDPGPGVFELTPRSLSDAFFAKYAPDGSLIWAHSFGGEWYDQAWGIDADASGNAYVTGQFFFTAGFDAALPDAPTFEGELGNIFVCKIGPAGTLEWVRTAGTERVNAGRGIKVDGARNVVCAVGSYGKYATAWTFDASSGNSLWTRGTDGSAARAYGVAFDPAGNACITGTFGGYCDFDPGPGTGFRQSRGDDVFVWKLDVGGNYLWSRALGDVNTDEPRSIAIDRSGNIAVAGYTNGGGDFDPGPAVAPVGQAAFVAKLDGAGNILWVRGLGSPTNGYGSGVAFDPLGNVFTTGQIRGNADLDPGPAKLEVDYYGGFLVKLDRAGNLAWANTVASRGYSVQTGKAGTVYVGGVLAGTFDLDPGPGVYPLSSVGGSEDALVLRLMDNHAPTQVTLTNATVLENAANGTVVGTAVGVDADAGDVLAYSLLDSAGGRFAIDPLTGVITVADGARLDFETASGHGIVVRATDFAGLSRDEAFTIALLDVNEPPVLVGPLAPSMGVPYQPLAFNGAFVDPDQADSHEVVWNFGDGTVYPFRSTRDPGALAPVHAYSGPGPYTVTCTVRDAGGLQSTRTQTITIVRVAVVGGGLLVGGTAGNDWFEVSPAAGGKTNLFVGGYLAGVYAVARVQMFGGPGNDVLDTAEAYPLPVEGHGGTGNDLMRGGHGNDVLFGDEGDDRMEARDGHDVLVGGQGNDCLRGGSGRNVIIGGAGRDSLFGGADEDILIAGYTRFDANVEALIAVRDEWAAPRTYSDRIANLRTGSGARLNGETFLTPATAFDDRDEDWVTAGGGADWFLANVFASDKLTDRTASERLDPVDAGF